jgi:carbamoylphosphate synthase large subunit
VSGAPLQIDHLHTGDVTGYHSFNNPRCDGMSGRCGMAPVVPKILIAHTLQWPNAARLALAFRAADCRVYALCRRSHPLHMLGSVERIFTYHPFAPARSLRAAIEAADPDLIVPCDDGAVALMHYLHSRQAGPGGPAKRLRAVIERSLGRPDSYQLLATRSKLGSIAARAGVLLPRTDRVATLEELRQWLGREGFPAVIKADRTSGGRGVIAVRTLKEAELAFQDRTGARNLARTIKRLIWEQDAELYCRILRGIESGVSVQTLVRGKPANCAVACWEGEVIAVIGVEVLATTSPTGNATVVRVVDNPGMYEAARCVVRRLGISGFCGFDFVIEETSGRPFLIEINPRATQINHLALGPGHDLAAALRARVADEALRESRAVTDRDTIALFPQEWRRNRESSFLHTAYHDVPNNEPELVQAYVSPPGWTRRLFTRLRTIATAAAMVVGSPS